MKIAQFLHWKRVRQNCNGGQHDVAEQLALLTVEDGECVFEVSPSITMFITYEK